ncbi:putative Relaxin receptor 1-like 3, partial [Homarus americanus]
MKEILDKPVVPWEERQKCNLKTYPPYCLCRMESRIHCKNLNLTSVPQDIDENVWQQYSIILTSDSFTRYPKLTLLHLQNNRITSLPRVFTRSPN